MKIISGILFFVLLGLYSCKTNDAGGYNTITETYSPEDSIFVTKCIIKRPNPIQDEPISVEITILNNSNKDIYVTKNVEEYSQLNRYSIHCGTFDSGESNQGVSLTKVNAGESIRYNIPSNFAIFKKGRREFSKEELFVTFFYFHNEDITKAGSESPVISKGILQNLVLKREIKVKESK
ncbi:MAG: hypothetical protein V4642_07565 [Bacteroidota bacterium]